MIVNALNKIILQTAVGGLVWTAVVFCYGMGIFAMIFPGTMASFYDTVGNKTLSAMYHGRVYQRDPADNTKLYTALEKAIAAKDDTKIIKYGTKFFALDAAVRNDLLDQVDTHLRLRAGADQLKLGRGCNEDDRLRCRYIQALLKRNKDGDKTSADAILHEAISRPINLMRPSYAILEFDIITDDQRTQFEKYYNDFVDEYNATTTPPVIAQYFVLYGKKWFNEAFA